MFPEHKAIVLHQDEYVKAEKDIPMIQDHIDWEVPESIDWDTWQEAIELGLQQSNMVIAEGLLVFAHEGLNAKFDKAIYVQIPKEVFLERKRQDLRWGKEPEWYIDYIWNAHLEQGMPPSEMNILQVEGNKPLDENLLKEFLKG